VDRRTHGAIAGAAVIYLIGALANPAIPRIANELTARGLDVFAEWYSPGPRADEHWREYELARGRSYREALAGPHAQHIFAFDKRYLDACDVGVLVMPAGKSGHLELGYMAGQGKRTYVFFEAEPMRYDLMYLLATDILFGVDELASVLA
jgi:hypothetical protein